MRIDTARTRLYLPGRKSRQQVTKHLRDSSKYLFYYRPRMLFLHLDPGTRADCDESYRKSSIQRFSLCHYVKKQIAETERSVTCHEEGKSFLSAME